MTFRPARATVARVLRATVGAMLGWCVGLAIAAPGTSMPLRFAALVVVALTMWRPAAGLTVVAALAPAGQLLAAPPTLAAELLAWSFVAIWLLQVHRPLGDSIAPRSILTPALLFGGCAFASWLALTIGGAAGVEPLVLPVFLIQSVPVDHVLFSSAEPETVTLLQTCAGLGLLIAAAVVIAPHAHLRRVLAYAMVASMTVLAISTMAEVLRESARYGTWYLLRYTAGERFSLHMTDLNAAGSLFVLGILIAAALAAMDRVRRSVWLITIAAMLPALWLSGSRSAAASAMLVGALAIPAARNRLDTKVSRRRAAILLSAAAAAAIILALRQPPVEGSAARSLHLRAQFLETSARMLASAPLFGVGIGRYHVRSNEFMPQELRAVYSHEHAHNYFAQQFGELGVLGGVLFAWLIAAAVRRGWQAIRAQGAPDAAMTGLFAGAIGYLITCITGHPLLVPEAALPFWVCLGAIAAPEPVSQPAIRSLRLAGAAAAVLVTIGVVAGVWTYRRTVARPAEQGFYEEELTDDSGMFRWMGRHAVTYGAAAPGVLTVQLRAPDLPKPQPFVVEIAVGGRVVDRVTVPADRWVTSETFIRQRTSAPFRRIDLRVNQTWSRMRDLGARKDDGPMGVMVRVRWTGPGSR